jgi:hypothetical protein
MPSTVVTMRVPQPWQVNPYRGCPSGLGGPRPIELAIETKQPTRRRSCGAPAGRSSCRLWPHQVGGRPRARHFFARVSLRRIACWHPHYPRSARSSNDESDAEGVNSLRGVGTLGADINLLRRNRDLWRGFIASMQGRRNHYRPAQESVRAARRLTSTGRLAPVRQRSVFVPSRRSRCTSTSAGPWARPRRRPGWSSTAWLL